MSGKHELSVIVPIYNVEDYLIECLDSINDQTLNDIEVLMIDDGSTDSSGSLAKGYAETHPNFKYFFKKNGGLAHTRNYGVQRASGNYIAFLDSDDLMAPDAYENMISAIKRDGSDYAIINVLRFNSSKIWLSELHERCFRGISPTVTLSSHPRLLYNTTSANMVISKRFFLENKFSFPEGLYYEDIPVTIPMHCIAKRVSVVRDYGYLWRARDGANKSITQCTSDIRNLRDRITVLRSVDRFIAEHPQSESVQDEWSIKKQELDLQLFVNDIPSLNEEMARAFITEIVDYVNDSYDIDNLPQSSLVSEQKIRCILDNDLESLNRIRSYEKEHYNKAATIMKDGHLYAVLPDELFSIKRRDITREITRLRIRTFIDAIDATSHSIAVYAHIYVPRYSISVDSQLVQCALVNKHTGEAYELQTNMWLCSDLTNSRGFIYDEYAGIGVHYDYDGAGFKAIINKASFDNADITDGSYILVAHCENALFCGDYPLRFTSGRVRRGTAGITSKIDRFYVTLNYWREALFFEIAEPPLHVKTIEGLDDSLRLSLSDAIDGVCVVENDSTNDFSARCEDHSHYLVDYADLQEGTNYNALGLYNEGHSFPLMSESRSIHVFHLSDCSIVVRSLRTYQISFEKWNRIFELIEIESNASSMTLHVETQNLNLKFGLFLKAELFVQDKLTSGEQVLASSWLRFNKNTTRAVFKIDFNNPLTTQNLYESHRDLLVRIGLDNVSLKNLPIFSPKYIKKSVIQETGEFTLYRNAVGRMILWARKRWPDDMLSIEHRLAQRDLLYPEFRKDPINEKLILFESMWGDKYSCNPRALYEYIDEHYPDYQCVWSLKDERTPIAGRGLRVRRGSLEYYYCLATAKYLVSNVNFGKDYLKRNGQIVLQTMHGTPMKSLGLLVEDELPTINEKREFIEKNKKWDYLIVQGRFMEDVAEKIYGVSTPVLRTGYPRTDCLFTQLLEKEKLKENLGLPKRKKVILYAPTWRKRGEFDLRLDFEDMQERLGEEYCVILRRHYFTSFNLDYSNSDFVFEMTHYKSIEDLYFVADIMVTDYSSAMLDWLLLNKPLLLFTYDLDEYLTSTRGMLIDYHTEAPCPLLFDSNAVIEAINNIESLTEEYKYRRAAFIDKYLGYENGNSCEMVVRSILQ